MVNVTLSLPKDLKEEMEKHREINWSEVARKAFEERLRREKAARALAGMKRLRAEVPSKGWSGQKEIRKWRDSLR